MRPSGGFLWKSDSVKARQPSHKLALEALEDRLVPAQIFVTTPDDVVDQADGLISLREAILQANFNADHDDILFPNTALNYQIKLNTPTEFGPTAFVISSDIAFRSSPGTTCTLSISPNAPPMRFFWVQPTGNLQLNDLTIFGGRIQGGSGGMGSTGTTGDIDGAGGGGGAGLGGAIYNQGTLTIERVTFIDNQAEGGEGGTGASTTTMSGFGGGGGSLSGPGQPGTSTKGGVGALNAGSGAGPFGTGTNGSMGGGGGGAGSISSAKGGNGGFGGGGGAYGGLGGYGAGSGAPPNSATGGGGGGGAGMGGAIFNESGNISISNSTFIDNQAFGGLAGPGGAKGFGIGGAIANLNGNVTINSSTFSANSNGAVNNTAEQAGSLVNIAINGLTANVVSRNSIFETSLSTPEFASFQASGSTATFSGNNNIVFNGSLASPLGIISNSSALLGAAVVALNGATVVPLMPGSPAIGAATPTGMQPFDQRDIPRFPSPSVGAYEFYQAPNSITVSDSSFAGMLQTGEVIGTLEASGKSAGSSFKFKLSNGIGDNHNAFFQIKKNELITNGNIIEGIYSIRVQATGIAGDSFEQIISLLAKPDIIVNTTSDTLDPSDGKTSLREAIGEANLNPDHDRITFDSAMNGIPVVLESVGSTAEGNSALVVSTAVSIQGHTSSTDFIIDPISEMRFFRVETSGKLRLENIDLSGGLARGDKTGDINGKGGAILAHGPVSMVRSSIVGAKVYGAGGANPGDAMGGAIYTSANLDLHETTIAGNTLYRGNDSVVPDQYTPSSSGNYYGAGIYVAGTAQPIYLNFRGVTIAQNKGHNQTLFAGGAVALAPGLTAASGPILFNADSLVVDSDANLSNIDILPGLGPVAFNVTRSFAGGLGQSVPTSGFTVGNPLLDPLSYYRESPVFRPQAGSPLIQAINNSQSYSDQTNLRRFPNSAAGAAEYYAPPQGLILSATRLGERLPAGLEAGIIQVTTSGESGTDFSFELVPGNGDTDNNAFRLEYVSGKSRGGAQISSRQSFLASDGDRSIRVRVTGPTGLSIEQIVPITISPSIIVDTTEDITDSLDDKISLREALAQASNQPGIDRISFNPNLSGCTVLVGADPINFTVDPSAFAINTGVLISGRDTPGLIIQPSAGSNIRFFNVSALGKLGLEALTLQGGNVTDGEGGAIFSDGGDIFLDSVTVRNNKASQLMAAGGAIRTNSGSLEIINSTFFNNSVLNATGTGPYIGEGGHILATNSGVDTYSSDSGTRYSITHCTFYNGFASGVTGGVVFGANSSKPTKVDVFNSVFAHATGNDLSFISSGSSTFALNFNSNSVESSGGLLPGTQFITGDPMLAALADNGGPTPTMEPLPGSPLIAMNGILSSIQPDQRGIIRGSKPTLGAFQVVQATKLSFTPPDGSLGIGSKIVFQIDFSHPVTYFGQPSFDLNVSGAQALAPAQPNGSVQSSIITLQYTVREGDSTNNLTASHANGGTFDVRDGVNHAVLIPQYNLVTGLNIDGIRPVPTIALTPNPGTSSNALKYSGTISFSEPVSGALLANDFKLTNATVSGVSGPDAAGNYSFNLTPAADGKVSVAVIAPGITDGAGNSSVPSNNIIFFSDNTPPAAQIFLNTTAGGTTNINNLSGKVSFGEPVTGKLSANDFTLVNASVSNISGPDANGIYTFNLNPITNGSVAVALNAPSIRDIAGNSATPASSFDFTFDNTATTPTLFFNPAPNTASNALSFFGTVAFGEAVKGNLLASDFKLTNANVSDISRPNATGNYSFTLTPVADGKVSVEIFAPGITDTAGNSFTPSNTITFNADRTPPAPVISLNVVAGSVTNANKLNGKVTFGEPVSGALSANDFTLVNASVSNINGPDANGTYTFTLNSLADGKVALTLNAPTITDMAGNSSTASSLFTFNSDTTAPIPAIALNPQPETTSNQTTFTGTISFFEPVSGTLLANDFKLNNATVSAISGPDAAYQYHFTLAPVRSGPVELVLNPNAIVDLSGNGSAISNLISFNSTIGATVDTTPPTLLSIGTGKLSNPTSFVSSQKFLVTFSEQVLGIDPNDFSIITSNEFIPLPLPTMNGRNLTASLSSITRADGGPLTGSAISSVLVTVNSIGRGTLSLELSPNATISDAAGNQIAAPGESVSYGYFSVDTTPLLVLSLGEIASPRTTPVDSISIELSKPLASPMQLEPGIRLLRNDKNFPLGNTLLITQTGYASYSVGNLGTRTGVEGSYQFLVSGANLRDSVGNLGTGLASSTWVSDGPLNVVAPAEFNPPVNFYQFATNVPNRVLLASFTDITGGSISDYEAHVNWGESGSSIPFDQLEALEILPSLTQPNMFDVFGTHTYTLDRNYLVNVLVKDSAEVGSFLFGFAEAPIVALTPRQINQQNLSTTTPVFVRGDINSTVLALSLFPDANANSNTRPLIQAVFNQVPGTGIDERALFLTGYAKNPERKPLPISPSEVASVEWLDLRASGVDPITDPAAFLNASFTFIRGSDSAVQLFYFNPVTSSYDRVYSSGGKDPVVNLSSGTVSVVFDSTSTPSLANLNGTVFAVTVSAPTSASNPTDTTTPVIAPTTPTTVSQTTVTTSASLVQASQTLSELARSDKVIDFTSGAGSSAFFVGGRSSTVSLTPSALGRGVSARTRSSAGARTLMASSKDAAMALGSILRGVIAPVEQKLKPWIDAFSTDNAKPIPMPGGAKPVPMAPAEQQAQPPAGAVAPQQNMQTSARAMPGVQHLVARPVQHPKSDVDADEVWLEPLSLEYSAGLVPLAGAVVLACSDAHGRKRSRKWTADDHAQGTASDESFP